MCWAARAPAVIAVLPQVVRLQACKDEIDRAHGCCPKRLIATVTHKSAVDAGRLALLRKHERAAKVRAVDSCVSCGRCCVMRQRSRLLWWAIATTSHSA